MFPDPRCILEPLRLISTDGTPICMEVEEEFSECHCRPEDGVVCDCVHDVDYATELVRAQHRREAKYGEPDYAVVTRWNPGMDYNIFTAKNWLLNAKPPRREVFPSEAERFWTGFKSYLFDKLRVLGELFLSCSDISLNYL